MLQKENPDIGMYFTEQWRILRAHPFFYNSTYHLNAMD